MRAFIDKTWAQLKEYLGKMSRGSRIRLAILSVLVVALAIVVATLLGHTNYVTMYTAQDQAEAGNIVAALREMGVNPREEGTRILVPEDRVSELRNSLAAQGVLGPTGLDLSIMQDAAGFAVTDAHAKRLYDAQLQEYIRVAIVSSPRIQNAIVVVSSGETSPFRIQSGVRAPHASVMLEVRGGGALSNQEAQTIAEYVMGAVPGIAYENIRIIDTYFNHYKVGDVVVDFDEVMNSRIALQNLLAEQIQAQAEQLLTPIFGMSNLRVNPTVRLNFDKIVTESVEFAPPVAGELDGIARSSHDLWEASRNEEAAGGVPGTDTNGMGTVEYPYGTLEDGALYERMVRERNYELNQTTEVIERAQGILEFLSIAVTINEAAVEEDYTEQVTNLLTRGFGIAPSNVAIERMPFEYIDTTDEDMLAEMNARAERERQQQLLQDIIMWAVILLLGIMFLLLVRTIVRAVKPPPEPEPVLVGAGIDYMVDEDELEVTDVSDFEEVELQTKSTGLEQIERFIDKDPGAVAQLLRNWLSDE